MQLKKWSDLTKEEEKAFNFAKNARLKAQSPYSNFCVGATVVAGKGNLFLSGCNVERASYSQTTHAEQNAIDSMVARFGSLKIERIAIVAGPKDVMVPIECWPCGHCRQIIWENCDGNSNVEIMTMVDDSLVKILTIGELFPYPFGPKDLGIDLFKK